MNKETEKEFDEITKVYVKEHGLIGIKGMPSETHPKLAFKLGFFEAREFIKSFISTYFIDKRILKEEFDKHFGKDFDFRDEWTDTEYEEALQDLKEKLLK